MAETKDVVIAGAGFAGLACSKVLASRGHRVTVLEKKRAPGSSIHTTGILVKEATRLLMPPEPLVRKITEVNLYAPSMKKVHVTAPDYFFLATDTYGLMRYMSDEAVKAGVDVRYGEAYDGSVPDQKGGYDLPAQGLNCRFLIGADGARSRVAEDYNLGSNKHYLVGMEVEFEGADPEAKGFHCFLGQKIAPGYIAWVVPGAGVTQVGLAVNRPLKPDLDGFIQKIENIVPLPSRTIVGRRSGLIPAGGLVKPFYRDNVILLGDSAGIVSPLTGGGIHTALHYGALLGERLADYLEKGGQHPGEMLNACYPRFRFKLFQRFVFEHMAKDWLLNLTVGSPVFRFLAEDVFFRQASYKSQP